MRITYFTFCLIPLLVLISGCKTKTDYSKNYNNTSIVAFGLVKECVDTMINSNPEINTNNYVLDLSSIDTLNKKGVDSFLEIKNRHLPTTLDDSTLMFKNGNPSDFSMKQSMIIKIRTISYKSDRIALITMSKIKSKNEIIDATIKLERQFDGYKINDFKITN